MRDDLTAGSRPSFFYSVLVLSKIPLIPRVLWTLFSQTAGHALKSQDPRATPAASKGVLALSRLLLWRTVGLRTELACAVVRPRGHYEPLLSSGCLLCVRCRHISSTFETLHRTVTVSHESDARLYFQIQVGPILYRSRVSGKHTGTVPSTH